MEVAWAQIAHGVELFGLAVDAGLPGRPVCGSKSPCISSDDSSRHRLLRARQLVDQLRDVVLELFFELGIEIGMDSLPSVELVAARPG
jgi:hypothetical protein